MSPTARTWLPSLTLALALTACGGGDVPGDASSADAGLGSDASAGDAAMLPDGGSSCAAGQHDCGGVCTDDGFNDPATGCRLGCGAACPGGTDAICNADGTCGLRGCAPMSCEDLGAACGLVDDGCGSRRSCGTCDAAAGQRCEANACVCSADPNEPNDSRAGLTSLTSIDDSVEPPAFPLDGTLHVATDEDWYQLDVVDGNDGGNPLIRVELAGVPTGSDYDVAAFFDCTSADGTDNLTTCTEGANDDSVEQGCTSTGTGVDRVILSTECDWTTDESGTLWVRVRAASWGGTCGGYTVRVSVT